MEDNKKNALNLLIETYKLYAAFCAIFIAGLLSFASTLEKLQSLKVFYVSIISLSVCSIICVVGLQYFISKAYRDICDIYSKTAKGIMMSIMSLLFIGVVLGILFIAKQEKMKILNDTTEIKINKIDTCK